MHYKELLNDIEETLKQQALATHATIYMHLNADGELVTEAHKSAYVSFGFDKPKPQAQEPMC